MAAGTGMYDRLGCLHPPGERLEAVVALAAHRPAVPNVMAVIKLSRGPRKPRTSRGV